MISNLDALGWCRSRNAMVRFESNNTVTVKSNGRRRRRDTFVLAVQAQIDEEVRDSAAAEARKKAAIREARARRKA